jgi:hypothetical protein
MAEVAELPVSMPFNVGAHAGEGRAMPQERKRLTDSVPQVRFKLSRLISTISSFVSRCTITGFAIRPTLPGEIVLGATMAFASTPAALSGRFPGFPHNFLIAVCFDRRPEPMGIERLFRMNVASYTSTRARFL